MSADKLKSASQQASGLTQGKSDLKLVSYRVGDFTKLLSAGFMVPNIKQTGDAMISIASAGLQHGNLRQTVNRTVYYHTNACNNIVNRTVFDTFPF